MIHDDTHIEWKSIVMNDLISQASAAVVPNERVGLQTEVSDNVAILWLC